MSSVEFQGVLVRFSEFLVTSSEFLGSPNECLVRSECVLNSSVSS